MTVLDHVTITASDFASSLAFYDAALGALGLVRLDELVDEEEYEPDLEAAAWGPPDGPRAIWLVSGAAATSGLHVRLRADSQSQVETFFRHAVLAGGAAYSTPRRWTVYRRGEFNAIVRDPDRNLIEAVAAEQ
jgi:catechol 2,3-dioxygenase-like lactoylglutathione lyase family enzyme